MENAFFANSVKTLEQMTFLLGYSFGQLFRIVKSEGLNLCNEIQLQSKHGSERAQSRKEMGTFCEAFGVTKIKAPSAVCGKVQKKRTQAKIRKPQPKTFLKKEQTPYKPSPNKRSPKKPKKPMVCYKCRKTGHKAFQCKTEQKTNEPFVKNLTFRKSF